MRRLAGRAVCRKLPHHLHAVLIHPRVLEEAHAS
jgi:hypothetical protein